MDELKVLIVDDEQDILDFLKFNLDKQGYWVYTANNGIDALRIAQRIKPELIILDYMLPDINGLEVCRKIRQMNQLKNSLIIFLTAKSDEFSQIEGLEAGADDYLIKPIKLKILISRMNAHLRRIPEIKGSSVLQFNNIEINKDNYTLKMNNSEIDLPRKEFDLLFLLMQKPERVFTRDEILESLWKDTFVGERTIDVHIRKLREKIGEAHIKTIKGVGYKFTP